jgi:teichuronic acid biosynthesis glycosyltransferase TuaG
MISILMPIYNGIEFVNQSVFSVINQTCSDWELIIGINGHPANSAVYLQAKDLEYLNDKIKIFDMPHIKGKSAALNDMLQYCKYEHVAILDVDDIWSPNKLQIQIPFINAYDVVGTQCVYFGEIDGIIPKIPLGDISNNNFKLVNPIINSSAIIRKSLCHWDSSVDGVEDYDLWLKLKSQSCTFYNCSEVMVRHRIHKTSAFNSKDNSSIIKLVLSRY